MPRPHLGVFTRFHQSVTSVLPDCFEESVASLTVLGLSQHKRLVYKRRQDIEDTCDLDHSTRADGLGCFQGPTSGKYRQPPKQHPLLLREQVVTPVNSRTESLVTRENCPATSGKKMEPVVQSGCNLLD